MWRCWILGVVLIIGALVPTYALGKQPTWSIKTQAFPDAQAGGWFINLSRPIRLRV
jgi:hypothetical protein